MVPSVMEENAIKVFTRFQNASLALSSPPTYISCNNVSTKASIRFAIFFDSALKYIWKGAK